MTTLEFLNYLNQLDIKLVLQNEKLRCNAPKDTLTPELQQEMRARKEEIVALLEQTQSAIAPSRIDKITHRAQLDTAPLSPMQMRLWLLNQIEAHSPFYNISQTLRLRGKLNIPALTEALNALIDRHEILRTTYHYRNDQVVQIILQEWTFDLPIIDLSLETSIEKEDALQEILEQTVRHPFYLAIDLMLRATLIRIDEDHHALSIVVHHIASDGWSIGILLRELTVLYESYLTHQSSTLSPLSIQYADFAEWLHSQFQSNALDYQLSYWQKQLAAPPVLELLTDFPRPPIQTYNGGGVSRVLPQALSQSFKRFCQESQASLFMGLLAMIAVLLSRYSRQNDIVIGSPLADRQYSETQALIGLFLNTLALRIDLSGNPTFHDLLAQVRQTALDAYQHQDVPFEQLVDELQPERHPSRSPWFQVLFAFQNFERSGGLTLQGLEVTKIKTRKQVAKFDLTFVAKEVDASIKVNLGYNSDLFQSETISQMLVQLEALISAAVADPDQPVSNLPLLPLPGQHQLTVGKAQNQAKFSLQTCVHHLFEIQVEKTPTATAVIDGERTLSYQDLSQQANQLAHHLQNLGVKPDSVVGLCLDRSIEMLVGIMGILKAGGAYLPLDPTYPQDRLAFMVNDAKPVAIVSHSVTKIDLADFDGHWVKLDTDWETIAAFDTTDLPPSAQLNNLAYVIYTSGSTGTPKGVMIEHRSLVNLALAAIDCYELSAQDRVLQFASISFDAAVEEIFPCLCTGATLILRNNDMLITASAFLAACDRWRLSVLDLPTAYWHQLVSELATTSITLPPSLRVVIVGGEAALPERVKQWQSWVQRQQQSSQAWHTPRLFNTYGPTEATVVATFYEVPSINDLLPMARVPIGRPLANVEAFVLDDRRNFLPVGVPGELFLGGVGLARGYLNQPQLTQAQFVPHLLSQGLSHRLYKTGDLVRRLSNGDLEFLGRLDSQVKIRGFRVELGEIETCLSRHPEVRQCAVVDWTDETGDTRLVAYCSAVEVRTPTSLELRHFAQAALPDYMVPSAFVLIDTLPLTLSGKLDRRLLPQPDFSLVGTPYEPPSTDVEIALADIWTTVLRLNKVSLYDNFFELGGHSLKAAQVIAQVQEQFCLKVSLRQLFETPILADLARQIEVLLWATQDNLTISSSETNKIDDIQL